MEASRFVAFVLPKLLLLTALAKVDPLPKEYVAWWVWTCARAHALNSSKEVVHYWEIAHYGGPLQLTGSKEDDTMLTPPGFVLRNGEDQARSDVFVYDDDW